jgi:hypothetical protein
LPRWARPCRWLEKEERKVLIVIHVELHTVDYYYQAFSFPHFCTVRAPLVQSTPAILPTCVTSPSPKKDPARNGLVVLQLSGRVFFLSALARNLRPKWDRRFRTGVHVAFFVSCVASIHLTPPPHLLKISILFVPSPNPNHTASRRYVTSPYSTRFATLSG